MLRIRTLGASEISIGDRRVGPAQPTMFTLLLLLAMADSAPTSRRELAALLWPDAGTVERNHRLRSLLHRVRCLGVAIQCRGEFISLGDVLLDYRVLAPTPRTVDEVRVQLMGIGRVLPDLPHPPSAALADRLDDCRDVIRATATYWLHAALDLTKAAGEWLLVEQVACSAVALDADDETAWLHLAEARCLTVDRRAALATIDRFLAPGRSADDGRLFPLLRLRQRIVAELVDSSANHNGADVLPLFGRDDILHRIWSTIALARAGHGGALLLWGPAGIGKTRLLREIDRLPLVDRVRVVHVSSRPVHAFRPLALVVDIAARLLAEPGAAGCHPAAYAMLRRLTEPNDHAFQAAGPLRDDSLFESLTELIAAVAEESVLVVTVDDVHVVASSIWRFMSAAARWSADRRIVWLFGYRALVDTELPPVSDAGSIQRVPLRCLDRASALGLIDAIAGHSDVDREDMLNTAGGHPLLLFGMTRCEWEPPAAVQWLVDDSIARLPTDALLVLRLLASIGGRATPATLAAFDLLSRGTLGAALGVLEHAGVIREEDGVLITHSIWSDAALATVAGTERLAYSVE